LVLEPVLFDVLGVSNLRVRVLRVSSGVNSVTGDRFRGVKLERVDGDGTGVFFGVDAVLFVVLVLFETSSETNEDISFFVGVFLLAAVLGGGFFFEKISSSSVSDPGVPGVL
jgi:predicted MFS family arabinose efflux permease